MGSAATTQTSSPSLKRQKSKIIIIPKEKEPEEPMKPIIAKVVIKQIEIPRGLDQQMLKTIEQLKTTALVEFENRFLLKVAKNQIRLVFKEQGSVQNLSFLSSKHHETSLKNLSRKCFYDLQIYREICSMKMKCLITGKLKEFQNLKDANQQYSQVKQSIRHEFSQIIALLLAEIQGKTCIWHSLNFTQKQKITNIINFLHEEGVNSQTFDIFKQKQASLHIF